MQERNDGYFVIVSSQEGINVKKKKRKCNVMYFTKINIISL